MTRLVEPFCGSAAVSLAAAARGRAKEFWLNDFNKPLAELLALMINSPKELAKSYEELWRADHEDALEHYYQVRESFNRTQDARLLLYLLARCVKGAVRYNGEGLFNQSPDKRRLGTRPETMKENIAAISALLRGKTIVTSLSYEDVLANVRPDDVVYMDPPYQGVCGERDELKIEDFMLLCGSANRAKSWSCEHCENWKSIKDKNVCLSCYWAFPEKYNHVAMRQIRRIDLVWQGEEIRQYEKLKSDAAKSGLELPQFVKDVLARTLK